MATTGMSGYDVTGCLGTAVILFVVLWACYYLYQKLTKSEAFALPTKLRAKARPSPIVTEAPYSNAPVKGEPKQVVTPEHWESSPVERTGNYTLAKDMVVRWDLIPSSARVVTFGLRMSNPPITGMDTHNKKVFPLVASIPASSGISVSFMDRGKYRIDAGRHYRRLNYVRDTSDYDPNEERIEVRFTQVAPGKTRVEMIYNGEDTIIASEKEASVHEIRTWPQKLKVYDTDKIQNIWLTYN